MSTLLSDHFSSRPSFQAVLAHDLFRRMAGIQLNSDQLINFFTAMTDFCAAYPPCHQLPDALRKLGHDTSADTVEHIVADKSGHEPNLKAMATALIYSDPGVSLITRISWSELNGLANRNLLEATSEVIKIFAPRHSKRTQKVSDTIGLMLAVEMITRGSIIPGEMMVFIDNPRYQEHASGGGHLNYMLEHPTMAYLKRLIDDGTEVWYTALIECVVTGELAGYQGMVEAGFDHACEAIATWYDAIEAALFKKL